MIEFGWIFFINELILIGAFLFLLITLTNAKRIYPLHWHVVSAHTIAENTEAKIKHLENLKMNLSKFQYPKQVIDCGIKKAFSIPFKNCVHLKQHQLIIAYHS